MLENIPVMRLKKWQLKDNWKIINNCTQKEMLKNIRNKADETTEKNSWSPCYWVRRRVIERQTTIRIYEFSFMNLETNQPNMRMFGQ